MRNFADSLDQIEEKKKDCDLIEAVKSLDNASNEAFFPIVQKIILATTFKLPEIRKTALPGTEGGNTVDFCTRGTFDQILKVLPLCETTL